MALSFDLLHNSWITCATREGTQQFSILQALEHAHTVRDIVDPSPLVAFGIFRLLLSIVHWLSPVQDLEDWRPRWAQQHFTNDLVERATERCRNVFDLFHRDKPFYQDPLADGKPKSVSYLFPEIPTGTSINHFRHAYSDTQRFCPVCCARGLTLLPPFCAAGGQGLSPSVNGVPVYYVAPMGESLFHALMLNLPIPGVLPDYDERCRPEDAPAWSCPAPDSAIGFLEGLTWQPRRTLLFPQTNDPPERCTCCGEFSSVLVAEMVFMAGRSPRETEARPWRDPNVPRWKDKSLAPSQKADFWRTQWQAMLPAPADTPVQPPPLLRQLLHICPETLADGVLRIDHFGFHANKAMPTWQFRRSLRVPPVLLHDNDRAAHVRLLLDRTAKAARRLPREKQAAVHFESSSRDAFERFVADARGDSRAFATACNEYVSAIEEAAYQANRTATIGRRLHSRWRDRIDRDAFRKKINHMLAKGGEKNG